MFQRPYTSQEQIKRLIFAESVFDTIDPNILTGVMILSHDGLSFSECANIVLKQCKINKLNKFGKI